MDWNKTKTIFILTFLVLNVYLMNEFLKIRNSSQHEYLTKTSLENRLKAEEIEITVELPKDFIRDKYISATPKVFIAEEIKKESKLKGQNIRIIDNTLLESTIDEPLKLGEKFDPTAINNFLRGKVLAGDQYRLWSRNTEENTITYYQQLDEKLFYKNINGELTFYLNDKNEVISYRQTILEDIEELSEEVKLLQPLKALETLYENGDLSYGDKITKVELGYYTLVHLASSQVLTPAWRFVVNEEEDFYVNAFEGQIIHLGN